jgi:hypothetical protein
LLALFFGVAAICASSAHAAYYKMVMCSADNGLSLTPYTEESSGAFELEDKCPNPGEPGTDPPNDTQYVRIKANPSSGHASQGDHFAIFWTTPSKVAILGVSAYTREAVNFGTAGWRARFWGGPQSGGKTDLLVQDGEGHFEGIHQAPTITFTQQSGASWHYGSFHSFGYELECASTECEGAAGWVDAHGFVFTLSDEQDSEAAFTEPSSWPLGGTWISGEPSVGITTGDPAGSGIQGVRLRLDGTEVWSPRLFTCQTGWSQANLDWARDFKPCQVGAVWNQSAWFDTRTVSDGAHTLAVCAQDFGQFQGLEYSGGESCEQRTIYVDNTPPPPPLDLHVVSSAPARYLDHFGARWSLPLDEGSPIGDVYYDIVDASGDVVVPMEGVSTTATPGVSATEVTDIRAPEQPGDYTLRLWLGDSAGEGAAATAPIPHDTIPPAAPQDVSVTSPSLPRSAEGFDVRWHNITDAGAPIDAVHYQVLNGAGTVVVPTKTVNGDNIQAIQDLEAPNERGNFTLRLWLSDAEDNVGAPASAPLSYECVRSTVGGGQQLTAALGEATTKTVAQGDGATLSGYLRGLGGNIVGAPLCIFSRPVTDAAREFLGIALTGPGGDYRFAIAPGPSRDLSVSYRLGQRELTATSTIQTVVHPTFTARRRVVRNKHFARFFGAIPGPHNDQVVIVLQAKVGKGWLAFHRYRTRNDGHFELAYRFNRTTRPTNYEMRAQVRETTGYPYLQGNSDPLVLRVLPDRPKRHAKSRCLKHKRVVRGHKSRCGKTRGYSGSRRRQRSSASG